MGARFYRLMLPAALPLLFLALLLLAFAPPHTPGAVIISEVAWSGTASDLAADEWIELYNTTSSPIDLANWSLSDGGDINITLAGILPANGFFLLERTDDSTVADVPADQIYSGALSNNGESLALRDSGNNIVDTANGDGGAWPAGSASPDYRSMERASPEANDDDAGWASNDGQTRNGLNAHGDPINGTPRQANAPWQVPPPPDEADLAVSKEGPPTALPGSILLYTVGLANNGTIPATQVALSDTLPAALAYLADDSGLPLAQPGPHTLVWQVGALEPGEALSFQLTATVATTASGTVTNLLYASTPLSETITGNNTATALTQILGENGVLIDALYYDGYVTGDLDEAIQLVNAGSQAVDIGQWHFSDGSSSQATLPPAVTLAPGQRIWLAQNGAAFATQFGFLPAFEVDDSLPELPQLSGSWPGFSNSGDEALLFDAAGLLVDTLVYEDGNLSQNGWTGPAVEPYSIGTLSGSNGQVLYRRRDQATGLPVPDSNSEADWAQTRGDLINGRKVRYPGWDLDAFFFPAQVTETAVVTLAIAPDNAFQAVVGAINRAQSSIEIETLTFENLGIMQALLAARQRGVTVTVLLEGGPAGGIEDQQKYICQQLEAAGAQCWFMISDSAAGIYDRYSFLHAKFLLIDQALLVVGSENLSRFSLPDDPKEDGTWGRRGVLLLTDAPGVVARAAAIFAADLDPAANAGSPTGHNDLNSKAVTTTGACTLACQARLGIWSLLPGDFDIGGDGLPSTPFRMLRLTYGSRLANSYNDYARRFVARRESGRWWLSRRRFSTPKGPVFAPKLGFSGPAWFCKVIFTQLCQMDSFEFKDSYVATGHGAVVAGEINFTFEQLCQ